MKKFIMALVCLMTMVVFSSCGSTYEVEPYPYPQTSNGWTRIADTEYYVGISKGYTNDMQFYYSYICFGRWHGFSKGVVGDGSAASLLHDLRYLKPTIDKYRKISIENNVKDYDERIDIDGFYYGEYVRRNYKDYINIYHGKRYGHHFTYYEFNEIIKALENVETISDSINNRIKIEEERKKREKERLSLLYK